MTLVNIAAGAEDRQGRELVMVECPLCGARIGEDYGRYSYHLESHDPEDLGLSRFRDIGALQMNNSRINQSLRDERDRSMR